MPKVMEYEDLELSLRQVFDFVAMKSGSIVINRGGVPAVRLSPVTVYRTTEPDPELHCTVHGSLFDDESADWESA